MELLLSLSSADPRADHAGPVVREGETRVVYPQMHIVNLDAVFPNRKCIRKILQYYFAKKKEEILVVCGSISQTRPVLSSFSTV
jgi:hypothetical protein